MTGKIKDIDALFEAMGTKVVYSFENICEFADLDAFRETYTPPMKVHTIHIGTISRLIHTDDKKSLDGMLDSLSKELKRRIEETLKTQQFNNPVESYGIATEPEDDEVLLFVTEESNPIPEHDQLVVSKIAQQLFDLRRKENEKVLEERREKKIKQEKFETFFVTIDSMDLDKKTKNKIIKQYKLEHGIE